MITTTLPSLPYRSVDPLGVVTGVSRLTISIEASKATEEARQQLEAQAMEMLADAIVDIRMRMAPVEHGLVVSFIDTAANFTQGRAVTAPR